MRSPVNRVLVALVATWPAAMAHATTYNVGTSAQLDQAIADSNANPGADVINIAPGTYTPSAGFPITDDLTVNGGGPPGTVLDQGSIWVRCPAGVGITVTINTLTVRNSTRGLRVGCGGANPAAEVRVNGSLFVGNQTGLYLSGDYHGAVVSVTNSTVSGNGLGVFLETGHPQEPVTLRNVTVFGNTIGIIAVDPPLTAIDSIVEGTPLLGPLTDNGGPTRTHAPRPGSPVIDAGGCSTAVPTDQRGVARPAAGCDLGAVEALPLPASVTLSAGTLINLAAVPESVLPTGNGKPAGVTFPHGFLAFVITGVTPGGAASVSIAYPAAIPTGAQYWKVIDGNWTDVTSLLGSDDGDNVLVLALTDGGLGDEDGLANGVIVDPGGVGSSTPTAPLCDTEPATIFVRDGVVVGGPLDGETYHGRLEGTDQRDVILGTDGHDRITAGDGDDVVCAGDGHDLVFGGEGHDFLGGYGGRDVLNGGPGIDDLHGGVDFDVCMGGEFHGLCERQIQ